MTGAPMVLVGPTASGKSAAALSLALRAGAEIVSADAMAVYRSMDIGTAKPTEDERRQVRHHLVDVVGPDEDYALVRFQREARAAVADIEKRGLPVLVVGGTGLYVRAIVDDFTIPGQFPAVRDELQAEPDTARLWQRLAELDPDASAKMLPTNRRRIERALEVTIGSGQPFSSFGPGVDVYGATRFRQVGLDLDRETMDERIDNRYQRQMAAGFLEEVRAVRRLGLSSTAAQALGYKELFAHLDGNLSLDEAVDEACRRTKKFARRQQRWFRRDPRIVWFPAEAPDLVEQLLTFWSEPTNNR